MLIEKGSKVFNVDMQEPCFMCGNPTKITIKVNNPFNFYQCITGRVKPSDDFTRAFITWMHFYDLNVFANAPIYKVIGKVARCVCKGCFHFPPKVISRRDFETGKKQKFKSLSSTVDELYEWFSGFDTFRVRKDCSNFFVPGV